MLKNRSSRTGFTLPEVLVTVAIVAVLAAVVVPTVTNQIGKGDDTNLVTNIADLRTSMTAFVSDARKYPSRLQNLTTVPLAADLDLFGGQFGAAAVARWKGPYVSTSLKALSNTLKTDSIFIGLAYAVDSLADTLYVAPNKGIIGLKLGGVANTAAALHIDSLLDNGDGQNAGNVRWLGAAPAVTGNRLVMLLLGH
jgi:prepilin-type N-terminal cleavage/methylation domain-containing protein